MTNYQQPYQPYQQPQWQHTGAAVIPQEDRAAAALAHASTLIAMVVTANGLPFLGPLLIWFLYKNKSPYVRHAAAGAFNFNIWLTIANIVAWIMVITVVLAPFGLLILGVTAIMQIWSHLRATLRSLRGENYRYPFETRILN